MSAFPIEVEDNNSGFGLDYNDVAASYRSCIKTKHYANAKEYLEHMKKLDKELASLGEP